jgi:hypothetical protein
MKTTLRTTLLRARTCVRDIAGHTHGRFQRPIRNLPTLRRSARVRAAVLAHALALTLLIAEQAPARFERAALRLLVNYCDELQGVDLPEG